MYNVTLKVKASILQDLKLSKKSDYNPQSSFINIIMLAEIITIGDEILIGQIVDTNSAWMATELNKIGVRVKQISSISDDKEHILKALAEATNRAQYHFYYRRPWPHKR
jgi:hypothetical protein